MLIQGKAKPSIEFIDVPAVGDYASFNDTLSFVIPIRAVVRNLLSAGMVGSREIPACSLMCNA